MRKILFITRLVILIISSCKNKSADLKPGQLWTLKNQKKENDPKIVILSENYLKNNKKYENVYIIGILNVRELSGNSPFIILASEESLRKSVDILETAT